MNELMVLIKEKIKQAEHQAATAARQGKAESNKRNGNEISFMEGAALELLAGGRAVGCVH